LPHPDNSKEDAETRCATAKLEGGAPVSLVSRPGLSAPAQSEPTVEGLGHRRGLPM